MRITRSRRPANADQLVPFIRGTGAVQLFPVPDFISPFFGPRFHIHVAKRSLADMEPGYGRSAYSGALPAQSRSQLFKTDIAADIVPMRILLKIQVLCYHTFRLNHGRLGVDDFRLRMLFQIFDGLIHTRNV